MGVHDSGYKQIFSFPAMVEDLIRGFVKEDWVDDLDFQSLERQNGSFVSDDLREREDDIIWRVKWRGSDRWMYVYLLIEFQTEHEPFMGIRLLTYIGLLYQDLLRTEGQPRSGRLPPVLPMVVYRGEREWTAPLDVKDLVEPPPGRLGAYTPSMRYLLIEEVRLDSDELESMSNLAAEIFRIEKSPDLVSSVQAFWSLCKWTVKAGPEQRRLIRAIKVWFIRAQKPAKLLFEDDAIEEMDLKELEPMLSERIQKWQDELLAKGREQGLTEGETKGREQGREQGLTEGEAKGREEGREQGLTEGEAHARRMMASRMLAAGMTIEDVARLTELDEETLRSLSG
ncbi:MAG: Rpn family recombination-promoting nuclease/putative transposase [Polyangia bacterium]